MKVLDVIKGKRTYYCVAVGLIYVGGAVLGFYELDERVLGALGLGGLAFLRAALPSGTAIEKSGVQGFYSAACPSCGGVGPEGLVTITKPGEVPVRVPCRDSWHVAVAEPKSVRVPLGSVVPLVLLCVLTTFVTGCAGFAGAAGVAKELNDGPGIVVLRMGTPWGNQFLTRMDGLTNQAVRIHPDGVVEVLASEVHRRGTEDTEDLAGRATGRDGEGQALGLTNAVRAVQATEGERSGTRVEVLRTATIPTRVAGEINAVGEVNPLVVTNFAVMTREEWEWLSRTTPTNAVLPVTEVELGPDEMEIE